MDALPYLRGIYGERKTVMDYPAGAVVMLMTALSQRDIFEGRVHREYAKIVEAKAKRKG